MDTAAGLSSQDLIQLAAAAGYTVAPRTLELWRYRGLLPRPARQPGGRGNWRYPPGTDRQLLCLLQWRQRTTNHDGICVALWIEGFSIDADRVRAALTGFIDGWETMIAAEITRARGAETAAVIDALAAKFAAMRSRAPVPRVVRMKAEERRRAYGYLLAVMFADEQEIARRRQDRRLAERMVGLRSGPGGGLAAVLQLDQDDRALTFPSPRQAREAVASAGPRELAFVRQLVQFFAVWFPALVPAIVDDARVESHPVVRLVDTLKDVPPGFWALLVIAFLVSVHSNSTTLAELEEHTAVLSSPEVDVEMLLGLPTGTRRGAYARLPADRQAAIAAQLVPTTKSSANKRPRRG